MLVILTDFGTVIIGDDILKAYGLTDKPKKMDRRYKIVKRWLQMQDLLERNIAAIESHKWIMGK